MPSRVPSAAGLTTEDRREGQVTSRRDLDVGVAPPRSEYVEPLRTVHGWVDVDLSERGCEEARERRSPAARGGIKRVSYIRRSNCGRSVPRSSRSTSCNASGSRPSLVAVERAALRRIAGQEQEGDQGGVRRRTVPAVAAQLATSLLPRRSRSTTRCRASTSATTISTATNLPKSECLRDVVTRMLPYWHDAITTDLARGARRARRPRTATACARWSSISTV